MLDDNIKDNLVKNNITQLFPVQSMVVPHLLKSSYQNSLGTMPRDICVSAPTGSGKTLAYIIPIVNVRKMIFVINFFFSIWFSL